MPENARRVTFTQTEDDLSRFFWYHLNHDSVRRLIVWGYYPIFVLGIAYAGYGIVVGLAPAFGWSAAVSLIVVVLIGLLAALVYPQFVRWLHRIRARRHARSTVGVVGERTYEVSPEGISWDWGSGQAYQKWTKLHRIVSKPDYIYLYQGRNQAHIFPRRAFSSPEVAEEFLRAVKRWQVEATGEGTVTRG